MLYQDHSGRPCFPCGRIGRGGLCLFPRRRANGESAARSHTRRRPRFIFTSLGCDALFLHASAAGRAIPHRCNMRLRRAGLPGGLDCQKHCAARRRLCAGQCRAQARRSSCRKSGRGIVRARLCPLFRSCTQASTARAALRRDGAVGPLLSCACGWICHSPCKSGRLASRVRGRAFAGYIAFVPEPGLAVKPGLGSFVDVVPKPFCVCPRIRSRRGFHVRAARLRPASGSFAFQRGRRACPVACVRGIVGVDAVDILHKGSERAGRGMAPSLLDALSSDES